MIRWLLILGVAALSLSLAQKAQFMREDPCRRCHYLAFVQGEPLINEKGEPIRFATRAVARAYEADYLQSPTQ